MKYINKGIAGFLCMVLLVSTLSGCGKKVAFSDAYMVYQPVLNEESKDTEKSGETNFFSDELCVTPSANINKDQVKSELCGAAGLFNLDTKEIPYGYHLYKKMYPASTTKILTALLAYKYGNLSDVITVSATAVDLPSGASSCNLKVGDKLTLDALLHGLMMESGNDAAIAIAEYVSGSVEKFSALMNDECKKIGATHSHFVNPNGLHDKEHYTTVYDLYLIFNEAIKEKKFKKLIHCKSYTCNYKNSDGDEIETTYKSTNAFLKGEVAPPEDVTILGGKTGTTDDAGRCLVLLSKNKKKESVISIVLKAGSSENLYYFMKKILEQFSNL
ncbi:MAG: D-alanyl-D-alanine carboxypeptidase [Lachnospiraceae bacterium]